MAEHVYVEILSKENLYQYVVPSFPVFKAQLREVKCRWDDLDDLDEMVHVFNGFARDIDLLKNHPLPAVAKLPVCHDNAFLIEVSDAFVYYTTIII